MTNAPVVHRDREEARATLLAKLESHTRMAAQITDPSIPLHRKPFCTHDPNVIAEDAAWRLRWIDCAPEGANYLLAPMQDKAGVPCGSAWREDVGPCRELRDAYAARGLHPIAGPWFARRDAGTLEAFERAELHNRKGLR